MEITLKFHRPEDKLPDTSRKVLIIAAGGLYWTDVFYSAKFEMFNVAGDNLKTAIKATYWAELPEVEE